MSMISVIIPLYNHAAVLAESVASLLAQTHRPLEIIIVNDGSTDNPEGVLERVAQGVACHSEPERSGGEESLDTNVRDPSPSGTRRALRVQDDTHPLGNLPPAPPWKGGDIPSRRQPITFKIINQSNQGAPAARNNGFAQSTGEFVIFWDADTIARPDMLEKMLVALKNNPGASYAYSDFKFGWKKFIGRPFDAGALRQNNYIDVTSLIRREDFCGFDVSIKRFQDWDLWLTLLEKNKTGVYVPEMLYQKLVGGRKGISQWLPSFVFKLPWKTEAVRRFEEGKKVVMEKHGI